MKRIDTVNRCSVAEGPLWDHESRTLYYVDILGECFYGYDAQTGDVKKTPVGQQIGCMALCENGDLLLALQDGVYRMDKNGGMALAHQPVALKGRRFNDGKVGPDGAFYLGTTDYDGRGAFYRLRDGYLEELFSPCACSNGLDWSADGTKMFYCDTPLQKIEVFDFDKQRGTLSGRRDFTEIPKEMGCPDGFCMDENDNILLGLWCGGAVIEIKSNGEFGQRVEVPAAKASCCCFGGDQLNELFITTAAKGDEEEYPLSGYVFALQTDRRGKKSFKYRY